MGWHAAGRFRPAFLWNKTNIMWQELFIAVALLLVIEGILPFMSPTRMRGILLRMLEMDDRSLRISGLVSMVIGVIMLYALR